MVGDFRTIFCGNEQTCKLAFIDFLKHTQLCVNGNKGTYILVSFVTIEIHCCSGVFNP